MTKMSINTAVTHNYGKYQAIGQPTTIGTQIANNGCSYRFDCLMVQAATKYWYIYVFNGNAKRGRIDYTVTIRQL